MTLNLGDFLKQLIHTVEELGVKKDKGAYLLGLQINLPSMFGYYVWSITFHIYYFLLQKTLNLKKFL